jgi:DNA-binding response OmpR family regulator
MIAIVSTARRETAALAALCEGRAWPCCVCESVAKFERLLENSTPRVAVIRHRLADGYSDDILACLRQSGQSVRTLVLASANFTAQKEARQIALGADCVLRDPIRIDVLVEYLAKFRVPSRRTAVQQPVVSFAFGDAHIFPQEYRIERRRNSLLVTPKEIEFLRILTRSPGKVVSYATLYSELLGRNFSGDTVNMRVLLGKTAASLERLGINLRAKVQIIPKVGYKYLPNGVSNPSRSRLEG